MQELADSLLVPLVNSFLLAELFWEESRRSTVEFKADGSSTAAQEWLRGAQLRAVDASSTATSWTTDLSARGLVKAFRNLGVGLTPPRVSSWPEDNALRLTSSEDLLSWREAAAELVARVRGVLNGTPHLDAHFSCEEYVRGSAAGSGAGRERRGRRILIKLNAVRKDRTLLQRARLFEGKVAPEALINSGLLEDLKMAWDDDPRKVGGLAGSMPVVVASGHGSGLFHELVGHSLEADYVLSGVSPFSGCTYGQKVTHSEVTITDSPDPALGCGGISLDDEGQIPKPITLINSGAVAGLLHDRVTATMAGNSPTGNGRRENFRTEPTPRMRNIVVSAGPNSPDSLLSGIRRGLYAERLSGGRADLAPGRFTLVVESGRRIERGNLREPLSDVLITGDILQTLSDIEGVGNDWHVSPEPMFCGKQGVVITGIAGPSVRLGPVEVFS
jgi:predicted Zn-dependent protease